MILCKSCNFENPDGLEFCDQCNAPLTPVEDTQSSGIANEPFRPDFGQVIGMRYIVLSEPVKVSIGDVFDAEDASDDSEVSLYLLPDYVTENDSALAELKSVTDKLADLTHDHLQSLLAADLEGDRKFFVYDKNDAQTLADKITHGPLSVEEVLNIFTQIARAIDFLHSRDISCHDLTPENIIVDEKGFVKLAYPVISKIIKDASAEQIDSDAVFISPEQIDGKAVRRSDIYSFAACICISLGGYFEGGRFTSLGILSEPQNLVLRNALNCDSLCRPATCAELLEGMEVEKSSLDWETIKLCTISVTADNSGQVFLPVRPGARFDFDTEIEIKAVPASNHYFVNWGGTAVEAGKLTDPDNPITKLTVDGDYTLNAVFKINTHVLKLSCADGGLISAPTEDDCQFDHGCEVTLKAIAAEHFHFAGWIGSAVDEGKLADPENPITTVKIDGDYSLEANFEVDCFSVQLSANDGGQASIAGTDSTSQTFEYGSIAAIIAQPAENHHFVEWTGSAIDAGLVEDSTLAETNVTVHADYTLSAVFEIDSYAFCMSSTLGGSIEGQSEGISEIAHGSEVLIKAVPDKNYHFVKWTGSAVDNGKVQDPENPVASLEIDDDCSIEAIFAINRFAFTLQPSDGGSIEIDHPDADTQAEVNVESDATDYEHGSKVSIIATADENFHFVEWAGSAVDARKVQTPFSPKTIVSIDAEYSLYAVFAIERHLLNLSSAGCGSVTEPSEGFSEYDFGRKVSIKAAPNENHHFLQWTGDAADDNKLADKHSHETSLTIDGDITLEAVFAIDQHSLSINSYQGGIAKTATDQPEKYDHGHQVELIATADENYHFVEWTGPAADQGNLADKNSAQTSLTIDGEVALEAVFAINQHSLSLSSNAGGIPKTTTDGSEKHNHGSQVEIIATADENYHFVEWTGPAVESGLVDDPKSPTTNITLQTDMTVQAVFEIDQKTLTVAAGDGGLVTLPGTGQYSYAHGEQIVIECYADEKYHFVGWTGSAVEKEEVSDPASSKTTIEITENCKVQPVFEKDKFFSKGLDFIKSRFENKFKSTDTKTKVIAAALLAAIILTSLIAGLKKSHIEKVLPQLWLDAQQKADAKQFDNAITIAGNILEISEDFAEDENIQDTLTSWNYQLDAQNTWLEVDQLIAQSNYTAAIAKAQAFITGYPDSHLIKDAQKQITKLQETIAIENRISEVNKEIDSGNPEEAMKLVKSILMDSPDNGKAALLKMKIQDQLQDKQDTFKAGLIKSAERFVSNSDWGKAINYYSQALEVAPNDDRLKEELSHCHHNLYLADAVIADQNKDYESAIQSYKLALSFKQVIETAEKLKLAQDAQKLVIEDQQKALTLKKLSKMAAQAHQNKEYAAAINIYEQIIESNPAAEGIADLLATSRHDLFLSLANSFKNAGKLSQALVSFNEALSFKNVESTQQQHDAVLAQFKELQQADNKRTQIANFMQDAKDAENSGDDGKSKALGFYEKAANAGSPEAMVILGDALYDGIGVNVDTEKAVQWFRKAVELKHAPAYSRLGRAYIEGKGKQKNIPAAFQCFKKGADSGCGRAMYYLSRAYHDGQGTERNLATAKDWLLKSADAGDIWGMHNLAILYHKGIGERKDIDKAIIWYQEAAAAGDVNAMYNLGVIYFNGDGIEKDQTKGMWWLTRSAENGNPDAVLRLGLAYYDGIEVATNYPAALKWLTIAAQQGSVDSMYRLGDMYSNGHAADKSSDKAIEYFTSAAENGNVASMARLGFLYFDGTDIKQDYEKAVKWFSAAADAQDPQSIYYMGVVFSKGLSVDQDNAKAFQCFTDAANAGHPQAMYELAKAYTDGAGVDIDPKMSFNWLEKAAKAGSHEAIFQIAVIYEEGTNVEQDLYESVRWYQKAAKLGNEAAKEKLADLNEVW